MACNIRSSSRVSRTFHRTESAHRAYSMPESEMPRQLKELPEGQRPLGG
jgi:hypothetical protein